MMDYLAYTAEIEIGHLCGEVEMTFAVTWERVDEPEGEIYWEASATFDAAMIGLKICRRADLVEMIGEIGAQGIEEDASVWFTERADEYFDAA